MSDMTVMALENYIKDQEIDIMCLSETKAKELPSGSFPNMKSIIRPNKLNPRMRGVAIIANSNIPLTEYPEFEPPTADMCVCVAKLGGIRYLLCSVYSPPNDEARLHEILSTTQELIQLMPTLKTKGILLIGDLNARHRAWGDHSQNAAGTTLFEFINKTKLDIIYKHNQPTFLCDNGSSNIDLLIASEGVSNFATNQYTDDSVELFTGAPRRGHVPVITELRKDKPTTQVKKYYKWKEANWAGFNSFLESSCEQNMPNFVTSPDPENIWATLKGILSQGKETFVPYGYSNTHSKPYWNKTLSTLSENLRQARRRFKHRSSYENGDNLEMAKTQFKDALSAAKQEYIENQSKNLNTADNEDFWKNFTKVFYTRENNFIGDLQDTNGATITEDFKKAEYLFKSIFGGKTNNPVLSQPTKQIDHPSKFKEDVEKLSSPITIDEITNAVSRLKTSRKSADFDGIHPTMLKQGNNFFIIALHCLYNKVLTTHKWPWGDSNLVIFIKKPGKKDYTTPASYRPITISSHVGKTFERILEQRLRFLIESWKLVPESQFGFRRGRSTLMCLLQLISETTHKLKCKHSAAALFLDLQKAFDTVPHKEMVDRIKELGISGNFLAITNSFLTSRKIHLKVNNHIHRAAKCEIGLPQGSVLSPLLFIVYIRDMLSDVDGTGLQYADDCTLLMTARTSTELQTKCQVNCDLIQQWMTKWKLKINYSKTEIVIFNGDLRAPLINNHKITISDNSKVLGITIDNKLTFEKQRSACTKSLETKMNMLKPFIYAGLKIESAKRILTQVILPKVLHGASLWDAKNTMPLSPHIKFLLGAHYNPPTSSLHLLIGIPPTELLYTKERLQLVKGLVKAELTHILSNTLKSPITKTFIADTKKIVHRSTALAEIEACTLSKDNIKSCILKEWTRRWSLQCKQGICPYGLLTSLPPDHLFKHPLPLGHNRKEISLICDLLTGQNRLQLYQYAIHLTYSPTCTCLEAEESAHHYLYQCKDYSNARDLTKPDINNWTSILQFLNLTRRLSFS